MTDRILVIGDLDLSFLIGKELREKPSVNDDFVMYDLPKRQVYSKKPPGASVSRVQTPWHLLLLLNAHWAMDSDFQSLCRTLYHVYVSGLVSRAGS